MLTTSYGKEVKMHGYFWCRERLKKKLEEFTGGQFLMETVLEAKVINRVETKVEITGGLVFRGEISSFSIPDMGQKRVLIYFTWLCERRFGLNQLWQPVPKWVLLEPPPDSHLLDVEFKWYYIQHRKRRIKMLTERGEVCRFYQNDDPSNLKQQGNEFLPCYEPPKTVSGPED